MGFQKSQGSPLSIDTMIIDEVAAAELVGAGSVLKSLSWNPVSWPCFYSGFQSSEFFVVVDLGIVLLLLFPIYKNAAGILTRQGPTFKDILKIIE